MTDRKPVVVNSSGDLNEVESSDALTLGGARFVGFRYNVASKTADYDLEDGDVIVEFTTSTDDLVAGLMTPTADTRGRIFIIGKIDSDSGTVVITPDGCNINGRPTYTLDNIGFVTVFDNGTDYWIIGSG